MATTIFEDTRNKPGKHDQKNEYFRIAGVNVIRTKLYVGDYTLPTNQTVCIDTKENMSELCMDVCQDHDRFRSEAIRAKEAGIRLIILIETEEVKSMRDVEDWRNPRLKYSPKAISGKRLYHVLRTMELKYGLRFLFVRPENSGEMILKLLGREEHGKGVDKT